MASQTQTLPDRGSGRTRGDALATEIERLEAETLARYRLRRLEAEVLAPARGLSDAAARLRCVVPGYVALAVEEPGLMTLFAGDGPPLPADLERRVDAYRRELENDLTAMILTQPQASQIDPTVAALSLLGIIHWGVCSFGADSRLSREDAVEQISRLALHGLATPAARTWPESPGGPGQRAFAA